MESSANLTAMLESDKPWAWGVSISVEQFTVPRKAIRRKKSDEEEHLGNTVPSSGDSVLQTRDDWLLRSASPLAARCRPANKWG